MTTTHYDHIPLQAIFERSYVILHYVKHNNFYSAVILFFSKQNCYTSLSVLKVAGGILVC